MEVDQRKFNTFKEVHQRQCSTFKEQTTRKFDCFFRFLQLLLFNDFQRNLDLDISSFTNDKQIRLGVSKLYINTL